MSVRNLPSVQTSVIFSVRVNIIILNASHLNILCFHSWNMATRPHILLITMYQIPASPTKLVPTHRQLYTILFVYTYMLLILSILPCRLKTHLPPPIGRNRHSAPWCICFKDHIQCKVFGQL